MATTREYDAMAKEVFAPLYPYYGRLMVERTGVSTGSLLDMGSGEGNLGFAVWEIGDFDSITFVDLREEALMGAAKRAEDMGIADKCRTLVSSVESIDLPSESIDLIVSRGSIPFWEDQRAAILELHRLLKPGGYAYLGGGMGTREMKRQIAEEMKRYQAKPFSKHRKNSKTLKNSEYAAIFEELGCSHMEIHMKDEGHWVVFGKADPRS